MSGKTETDEVLQPFRIIYRKCPVYGRCDSRNVSSCSNATIVVTGGDGSFKLY